jgi:hypothetical protein
MRSNDLPLNLFPATAAVPIPKDHPAYTGPSLSRRGARRVSMVVATIAGLSLVAAISSAIANYMLETAAPVSEDTSTSVAIVAAVPAAQPTPLAAESPTTELSSAPPVEAAPSTAAIPSASAAPPVGAKYFSRPGTKPTAFLPRTAAARREAEHQEVAALPAPPPADAMLFADRPPVDLAIETPGVDNTNRR